MKSGGDSVERQSYRAGSEPPRRTVIRSLFALVCIQLGFNAALLPLLNIHWDEFHYFAQIHEYLRGAPLSTFQTFHVHPLSPLVSAGADEIESIVYGRHTMFLMLCSTVVMLCGLLRPFGLPAALFAILGFLSLSETVVHGASFRSDPLVGALFLVMLVVPTTILGAGISGCAAAFLVLLNLKGARFVAWAALFRVSQRQSNLRWWATHGLTAFSVAAVVFFWHSRSVVPQPQGTGSAIGSVLNGFLFGGLSAAGISSLAQSAAKNPVFWIAAAIGCYVLCRSAGARTLALFPTLVLPLCLFYRNAWPYFIPLAAIPATISVAAAAQWWLKRRYGEWMVGAAAVAMLFSGGRVVLDHLEPEQVAQQELVNAVHAMFPLPVPYIDRCSMISSFPSEGPFLTSWQLERYHDRGTPMYGPASQARFLIVNSPAFTLPPEQGGLLEADREFLQASFVQWWGPLYLRGVRSEHGGKVQVVVAGEYRLKSKDDVRLNGMPMRAGERRFLSSGEHQIDSAGSNAPVELILLPPVDFKPAPAFPRAPLFRY